MAEETNKINLKSIIEVLTGSAKFTATPNSLIAPQSDDSSKQANTEQLAISSYFSEPQSYHFLESSNENIVVIVTDAAGVYRYVSPSIYKLLGFMPEYFIGKSPFQLIHPSDLERLQQCFFKCLNSHDPVYVEPFRMLNFRGEWVWIESVGINKLHDPSIDGLVLNAWNASEKMNIQEVTLQAEKALKVNNERYQSVTDATFDVIWDWDILTDEVNYSNNFYSLFGYTQGEKKHNFNFYIDQVHPDDREKLVFSPHHIMNGDIDNWMEQYRFKKANGQYAFVQDKAVVIRDENGKATRMIGAMRDITELRKKELQIIEQKKQLLEIAQINAHSIRGPLATILGLIQLFNRDTMGEDNRQVLEYLKTATNDLDEVIHSIILKAHMNKTGQEV